MIQSRYLIAIGIAAIIILYSYLVSMVYAILLNNQLNNITPISIWLNLPNSSLEETQSQLFVSFGLPLVVLLIIGGQIYEAINKNKNQFGRARWANIKDLKKAHLLGVEGVILGKFKGRYLMNKQPTHSIIVAPTRSGKGVGIVVPNLLGWKGSVVCLDVKHENYQKTSGYRQRHGQRVFMWSPMDDNLKSHRYNPLDVVSRDPHQQVSDLQVIAKILIQDPPKSDPVWASEARALFVGLALYVIDSNEMPSTIGAVNRLLGTEADLGDVCRHIVTKHPNISTTIKKSLMNFANKAAKERSGVKSSLNQAINLWDNPLIDAATSATDFKIEDLRKEKMSIYVGVLTGQIETLTPLLRIFFEQLITKLSMKEPDEKEPYKVLMLLDEFHMLGRIDSMTTAFTLLAGYNVRVMAVVQSLNWLDVTYGRDKRNGILSCCAHQVFYATNDLATAQYVSESCGNQTINVVSSSKRKSFKYESPTYSTSQRGISLIEKNEMRDFSLDHQIILVEGSQPVKCKKIRYYEDKNMNSCFIQAPAIPELLMPENAIPMFNIQSNQNDNYTDPNQSDFNYSKMPVSLTDGLSEKSKNIAIKKLMEELK